jgi:hypothetical protein
MADTLEEMVEVVKGFVGDSGVCSYDRAVKAVNQARRLLWNKRAWTTQEEYVQICCVNDCFTLPSRYEQIKLAWIGNRPASLADEWFNATDSFALQADQSCHRGIVEVGGLHVLFRDYTTHFYQIGVMAEEAEDIGVELMFEAQDQYDTYHKVKVTTDNPPTLAKSDLLVKGIRAVTKPITKGRIRVYAYDTELEAKTLIAIYQPNDANPTFRRFKAPRTCECITLYASKKYFDLVDPKELVEFNADAMIYAVLALNSRENRKAQEFMANLSMAVQEQEKEMEGYEIPTAAPLRIANFQRPENLIGNYLGSPSADDYFFQPSWP